ncbi:hypothetical protein Salmuc_02025 [Salipiger mucosus DSM 16094]|uniref:Uncharacterized protein n=2 Tax=Salipiger mucosus TaxID=263378 RepID=S9QV10_9RHOB|nr:hypothetical protein Salmuc_02025 [Salipiger mucosus DSM 16094]
MASDGDRALFGGADLNHDGQPEYMVFLDYEYLCNDAAGCPLLLYSSLDTGPFARLRSAAEEVAVPGDAEDGKLKSIYTAGPDGGVVHWSWDAEAARYEEVGK